MDVPAEMLKKNGRAASEPILAAEPEDQLRAAARRRVDLFRRAKFHLAAYVLGMLVLTPVWLLVEWQSNGRFQHWSNNGSPGDWEPWILYVALAWGLFVGITALRAYFERPSTETEIDREVRRLASRG